MVHAGYWDRNCYALALGEQARHILQEHADEFSPYWYELGLLHFLNGELVKAATAFRRGFAANTHIAEILCGNLHPFHLLYGITFQAVRYCRRLLCHIPPPLWGAISGSIAVCKLAL